MAESTALPDDVLQFLDESDLEYFPLISPEESCLDLAALTEKYDLRFPTQPEINTERVPPEDRTNTVEKKGKGKKKAKAKSSKVTKRFRSVSADEINQLSAPFIPKTTNRSTAWAKSVFDSWNDSRDEDKCPQSFLDECRDPTEMEKWLKLFVVEGMYNRDGDPYPPDTIYSILTGILRYMRQRTPRCKVPNFLDRKNQEFAELHSVTDHIYRKLRTAGIGASKKSTEIITKEEENTLWERGVLGIHTPQALLNATFFLNGKNLALRGGKEHIQLKFSQLQRLTNPDRYVYQENGSKNRSGGIADFRVPNKEITIHLNRENPHRCHVHILDEYIAHVPKSALQKDAFYLQCVFPDQCGVPGVPWFKLQKLGINKLQSMVKNMCMQAGIPGHKTNHSLRATCATQMYEAGVPEKIIQDRTGHRSLSALRKYERPSDEQLLASADVLNTTNPVKFQPIWDSRREDTAFNKENTPPPSEIPVPTSGAVQPLSQPGLVSEDENKKQLPQLVPNAKNVAFRPVNFQNCHIQFNLSPNQDQSTILDRYDTPFAEDLGVFELLDRVLK